MQIDPEILSRLDALAAKLGVTADHLWGILLAQAQIYFYASLFGVLAGGLLLVYAITKQKDAQGDLPSVPAMFAAIVGGMMLLFGGIVFINTLNPEFWALRTIMQFTTGVVR